MKMLVSYLHFQKNEGQWFHLFIVYSYIFKVAKLVLIFWPMEYYSNYNLAQQQYIT